MRSAVTTALLDAWAVLQPVECAGCGAPDRAICERCRRALVPAVRSRSIDGLEPALIAASTYDGVLRRLLLAGKDHGRSDALRVLGPMLAAAVGAAAAAAGTGAGPLEVAWVPSTRASLRRRGFDPVLVVLRSARIPRSRVLSALGAQQQKALDRDRRLAGAPGRLRPVGALRDRRFLLVDDVVTTGATVRSAVDAIRLGGGDVLAVCCLGTVDLRGSVRDSDAATH